MLFVGQKFIDGLCRVTWGVVEVRYPSAGNASSHTYHPFTESFKDFPIKSLIDSLSWWHKFLVEEPLVVKTNEYRFDFGFTHSRFLGMGRVAVCYSRLWRFVSKIHDSSPVITRLKNSGSLSRRSKRSRHTSIRLAFCSVVRFFGAIFAHFSQVQIMC